MKTMTRPAFPPETVDRGFASRSAEYLAAHGYRPEQIRSTLVERLDLSSCVADEIVSSIAA